MDEETNQNLRFRIKERAGKGDIIVGACCRTHDQEDIKVHVIKVLAINSIPNYFTMKVDCKVIMFS